MITPLRLQAYERAILFLERISPENLIMRVNKSGFTCQQLQSELMQTIRSEFEHNLSQQIYISHGAWEMLKIARGRTIQLINSLAEKIPKDSPSINLSKAIWNRWWIRKKPLLRMRLLLLKRKSINYFSNE